MSKYAYPLLALLLGCAVLWLLTDAWQRLSPIPDLKIPPIPAPPLPDSVPAPGWPVGVEYGKVNKVDGQTLEKLVKFQMPMLVKFGASWCGPCNTIKPHLEQFAKDTSRLAEEPADEVLVVELEITEGRVPFDRYRIKALPTLVVFWGGEQGRVQGALTAKQITKFVDGALHAN